MPPPRRQYVQPRTEFGLAVTDHLSIKGTTQKALAICGGVSPQYMNAIITGRRVASAKWADMVATALGLSETNRIELHVAAARDQGYQVPSTVASVHLVEPHGTLQ